MNNKEKIQEIRELEYKTIELNSWDKKTIRGRKFVESNQPVNPLGMVYLFIIIWVALGIIFHVSSGAFMLGFCGAFYSSIGVTYLLNKHH